ncbi:MAG TPA: hypothetical protein VGF48_11285 [Thermoanaerobaculia bacterium]|jgi:uncharacterized paraquat-inducible protein A
MLSCPRCTAQLFPQSVRSGENYCTFCSSEFEATTFRPPQRRPPVVTQIEVSGPEEAAACANHARNAAVTSCQRCGLLICSLCDMNVGDGSYCPSCFERVRADGTSRMAVTRYRDHAGIARLAVLAGFLFFCVAPLFSPLALWFGRKGIRQRREEGSSIAGMIVVMVVAVLELLASVAWYGSMIYSLLSAAGAQS